MLKNKTAVITGCNRGIGKAILEDYVKNGADIFAVVRKKNDEFIAYCDTLKKSKTINKIKDNIVIIFIKLFFISIK